MFYTLSRVSNTNLYPNAIESKLGPISSDHIVAYNPIHDRWYIVVFQWVQNLVDRYTINVIVHLVELGQALQEIKLTKKKGKNKFEKNDPPNIALYFFPNIHTGSFVFGISSGSPNVPSCGPTPRYVSNTLSMVLYTLTYKLSKRSIMPNVWCCSLLVYSKEYLQIEQLDR